MILVYKYTCMYDIFFFIISVVLYTVLTLSNSRMVFFKSDIFFFKRRVCLCELSNWVTFRVQPLHLRFFVDTVVNGVASGPSAVMEVFDGVVQGVEHTVVSSVVDTSGLVDAAVGDIICISLASLSCSSISSFFFLFWDVCTELCKSISFKLAKMIKQHN